IAPAAPAVAVVDVDVAGVDAVAAAGDVAVTARDVRTVAGAGLRASPCVYASSSRTGSGKAARPRTSAAHRRTADAGGGARANASAATATKAAATATAPAAASTAPGKARVSIDGRKYNHRCNGKTCCCSHIHCCLLFSFFEARDVNLLRILSGLEDEVGRGKRRIRRPTESRHIGGMSGIAAIDDRKLFREGLIAFLDPNFPIAITFAERIVIGGDAVDGRGPDEIARGQLFRSVGHRIVPAEQVFQRQRDVVL